MRLAESTKICRDDKRLGYRNRWPPGPDGVPRGRPGALVPPASWRMTRRERREESPSAARLKPVWTEAFFAGGKGFRL